MPLTSMPRRRLLAASALAPLAAGCAHPLPLGSAAPPGARDAETLLAESADAHGAAAFRTLGDINIAYAGAWRPLIDRVQPVVVDKAFRGRSEERLLPGAGVVAQAYSGTAGRKHVWWRRGRGTPAAPGEVAVWFNGAESRDDGVRAASALVAEGYGLFLLGPLWLAGRGLPMQRAGTERVDGRLCDRVDVWMSPGLGQVALDRVSVCIDAATRVTRRVRFTLEGFPATKGAVAEVDTFDHERRFGVLWPMRSYEEVVHPIRLPAHDWHVTGLDVNRGYAADALRGPAFSGAAAAPAARV
jgi:hypothetical protein